jgi:uncharacterized protein (DUF952 family)
MTPLYQICTRTQWSAAEAAGVFEGSAVDRTDGFIHLSTRAQVEETARRHFAGQVDLVLVELDADPLGPELRWEPSRGGDLFPHLYAPLPVATATSVVALPLAASGEHVFPWTESMATQHRDPRPSRRT